MILAVVLGLALSWKLAVVAIAMPQLIIFAFHTRAIMMKRTSKKLVKAQDKSSALAREAVGNHRIITAFHLQEKVLKLYDLTQITPKKESTSNPGMQGWDCLSHYFWLQLIQHLFTGMVGDYYTKNR